MSHGVHFDFVFVLDLSYCHCQRFLIHYLNLAWVELALVSPPI